MACTGSRSVVALRSRGRDSRVSHQLVAERLQQQRAKEVHVDRACDRAAAEAELRGRGIVVDAALHVDGAVDGTPHRSLADAVFDRRAFSCAHAFDSFVPSCASGCACPAGDARAGVVARLGGWHRDGIFAGLSPWMVEMAHGEKQACFAYADFAKSHDATPGGGSRMNLDRLRTFRKVVELESFSRRRLKSCISVSRLYPTDPAP